MTLSSSSSEAQPGQTVGTIVKRDINNTDTCAKRNVFVTFEDDGVMSSQEATMMNQVKCEPVLRHGARGLFDVVNEGYMESKTKVVVGKKKEHGSTPVLPYIKEKVSSRSLYQGIEQAKTLKGQVSDDDDEEEEKYMPNTRPRKNFKEKSASPCTCSAALAARFNIPAAQATRTRGKNGDSKTYWKNKFGSVKKTVETLQTELTKTRAEKRKAEIARIEAEVLYAEAEKGMIAAEAKCNVLQAGHQAIEAARSAEQQARENELRGLKTILTDTLLENAHLKASISAIRVKTEPKTGVLSRSDNALLLKDEAMLVAEAEMTDCIKQESSLIIKEEEPRLPKRKRTSGPDSGHSTLVEDISVSDRSGTTRGFAIDLDE